VTCAISRRAHDLILAAVGEARRRISHSSPFYTASWRGGVSHWTAGAERLRLFLGTALTLFLIVPALIMASGILGVTPLTGVVTRF
jgi:hypothetical protein